jgi:hypothetical protein
VDNPCPDNPDVAVFVHRHGNPSNWLLHRLPTVRALESTPFLNRNHGSSDHG